MPIPLLSRLDAQGRKPIINAAPGTVSGDLVTFDQLQAIAEGVDWKLSARVASIVNVNLLSPGAVHDGITLAISDRMLQKDQTVLTDNGIYIYNGAAVAMTRALDANTFDELESAIIVIDEGTSNAGTSWRQTQTNGVIGTNNILWTSFLPGAAAASEATPGIARVATQVIVDAGTNNTDFITALKLATTPLLVKRKPFVFGDGAATSFVFNHNMKTRSGVWAIRETGGTFRDIITEVQRTTVNSLTILFDVAPALNSLEITFEA